MYNTNLYAHRPKFLDRKTSKSGISNWSTLTFDMEKQSTIIQQNIAMSLIGQRLDFFSVILIQ